MIEKKRQLPLILFITVFTIIVSFALIATRKKPEREERVAPGPLVEVISLSRGDIPVTVCGNGSIRAKNRVSLIPQVSGRVVSLHRGMVEGGFFSKDDTLVTIEPQDYELALQQAEADLVRAEVQLEVQKAEADAAT